MLPVEFRDALAQWSPSRCMLTTQDHCIVARPWPEWERFESALTNVRAPSYKLRDYCRLVLGGAEELLFDPQNRLRLSRAHMEYAGLNREVVLVGQVKRFEIWDVARFKRIQEQDFEGVDQELMEKGIDIF